MLTITPKAWCSWDFTVVEDGRPLASIALSNWSEKGVLTIEGVEHRVHREGFASGDFVLERDGSVLVRADKPSAFSSTLLVSYQGRQYTLKKKSAWRRGFVVVDTLGEAGSTLEREVGSLVPVGAMSRDAHVDLPKDWPLPLQVFVMWLTIIMWKREHSAAA